MPTVKYRGAKHVPVEKIGTTMTSGPHKGEQKLRTLRRVGKRPKGSIDWRHPDKIYR